MTKTKPLSDAQREVLLALSEPDWFLVETQDGWNYWPSNRLYVVAQSTVTNLLNRGAVSDLDSEAASRFQDLLSQALGYAVQEARDRLDEGCHLLASYSCERAHYLAHIMKSAHLRITETGRALVGGTNL